MPVLSPPRLPARESARSIGHDHGPRLVAAAYLAGACLLALIVEPAVLKRIAAHDYHNFDLGIYSQALYLIDWRDWNPWLTVRQTKVFNDHFDPILLLVAPAAKIFGPAIAAAVAEVLFVLASPLAIVWLYRRGAVSAPVAALAIVAVIGNRAVTNALQFPAHPTTWAILPMSLLVASIVLDKRRCVFAACTLLFAFKEEFPFVGLMVGLLYLARREYRFGLAMTAWSLAWIFGVLYLRPVIVGPVHSHAAGRFVSMADWEGIRQAVAGAVSRPVLHALVPVLPLAVWAMLSRRRPSIELLLLVVPLLAIRFLGRAWGAHYLAPLIPVLVLALVPLGAEVRVPRWVGVSTVVLLVAISLGPWKRSVELLVNPKDTGPRPPTAARLAAIELGRQYLLTHPSGKALVQGNLVPCLVRRRELYQVAGAHHPDEHTFRYVFIEIPPHGDPWPIDFDDYRRLIKGWREQPDTRIILDNQHVWLAEGSFGDHPRR